MTTTITVNDGSGRSTTPDYVMKYQSQRRSRNVITDLIGGDIAVALIPPAPRSGVLRLQYHSEADALAALDLHALPSTFTLSSDDNDALPMTYVVDPAIDIGQHAELDDWTFDVGYQEITP